MAKEKKRKKKYVPKPIKYGLMEKLAYKRNVMSDDQLLDLDLAKWIKYDTLKKDPDSDSLFAMYSVVNCVKMCNDAGFGDNFPELITAIAGLDRAVERFRKNGSCAVDGPTLQDIPVCLDASTEQFKKMTRETVIRMCDARREEYQKLGAMKKSSSEL